MSKSNYKDSKVYRFFDLFFTFARIGLFTFGGGLAMMPMMQKELVDKKQWITEEDLIDYYAVGQSTPGIIAVNVATFVGHRQFGIFGGIFATLGIIFPSLVIISFDTKVELGGNFHRSNSFSDIRENLQLAVRKCRN